MKILQHIILLTTLLYLPSGFTSDNSSFNEAELKKQLTSSDQKAVQQAVKEIYKRRIINDEFQDLYNALLLAHSKDGTKNKKIVGKLIRLQKLNLREEDFKAVEAIANSSTSKHTKKAIDYVISYRYAENYNKHVAHALDSTQKETNLNRYYIANLWAQDEFALLTTLKSLDLLAFIDIETTDAMYEFAQFQIEIHKMSKSHMRREYIDDMLVILAKSGNKKYLPVFDKAINSFPRKTRYIKIKNNLFRHKDKAKFTDSNELTNYYINHLGNEFDIASNNKILKSIHATGIQNQKLWEKANNVFIESLEINDKTGDWSTKAIASSGNLDYKPTIDAIIKRPVQSTQVNAPNAVHKSIHKYAIQSSSKIIGFNYWFQVIQDMRNNIYNLDEEARHFLSLTASPIWRLRFIGIKWIALNRYKDPAGMELLTRIIKHNYSDAPHQGKYDIVAAAKLSNWFGVFCNADCIPHLEETVNSITHKESISYIEGALKKIKKRHPAG